MKLLLRGTLALLLGTGLLGEARADELAQTQARDFAAEGKGHAKAAADTSLTIAAQVQELRQLRDLDKQEAEGRENEHMGWRQELGLKVDLLLSIVGRLEALGTDTNAQVKSLASDVAAIDGKLADARRDAVLSGAAALTPEQLKSGSFVVDTAKALRATVDALSATYEAFKLRAGLTKIDSALGAKDFAAALALEQKVSADLKGAAVSGAAAYDSKFAVATLSQAAFGTKVAYDLAVCKDPKAVLTTRYLEQFPALKASTNYSFDVKVEDPARGILIMAAAKNAWDFSAATRMVPYVDPSTGLAKFASLTCLATKAGASVGNIEPDLAIKYQLDLQAADQRAASKGTCDQYPPMAYCPADSKPVVHNLGVGFQYLTLHDVQVICDSTTPPGTDASDECLAAIDEFFDQ